LTVTEKKALSNLRTNTDHAILQADKGSAKVVLETVDYIQMIGTLLQDPPHLRWAKGPTETVERKTTLVPVLNKSTLAKKVCIRLDHASTRPPRLCGFPKIHKEGISLRPTVSNIGAPTYQLSKYLAGALLTTSETRSNLFATKLNSVRSACKETARYAVPSKFLQGKPRYRIIVLCCK